MTAEGNDGRLSGQVTKNDSEREEPTVQETPYTVRFSLSIIL